MKKMTFVLLVLLAAKANGQKNDYIGEINQQVWKTFVEAFNNDDDERFSSVHSREVSRVEVDGNRIYGYDQYFKKVPDSVKAKWGKRKKDIELRFTQRMAGADKAFETGYYKLSSTDLKTGKTRTAYGKFQVLLRKENGIWKILMDADTGEGASEEVFRAAKPME
jgi:ketosteroid isomerase-like protein